MCFSQNPLLLQNSNYGFEILCARYLGGRVYLSLIMKKLTKNIKTGIASLACFDVNKTILLSKAFI